MILYIDTTDNEFMTIALFKHESNSFSLISLLKIKAFRKQSEKLLPNIEKILKDKKMTLSDLDLICVNDEGGSFTSLRIGIITANALAYALKIKVQAANITEDNKLVLKDYQGKKFLNNYIVEPKYSAEPNITKAK